MPEIRTSRLLLRYWRESDREPFARMNADPIVREHFPSLLNRRESDAGADRIEASFTEHGFGLWALELVGEEEFIGFAGLASPQWAPHLVPGVEVGWSLMAHRWGQGYATEAARAALDFAFDRLQLQEVLSLTVESNLRSRAVMERLGMTHDTADDFEDQADIAGLPPRLVVLYRLSAGRWTDSRRLGTATEPYRRSNASSLIQVEP